MQENKTKYSTKDLRLYSFQLKEEIEQKLAELLKINAILTESVESKITQKPQVTEDVIEKKAQRGQKSGQKTRKRG